MENKAAPSTSPPPATVVAAATDNVLGFRRFLTRTNAMALAVGVIIATATTGFVNSIVQNLINPVVGVLLQNVDLSNITIPLGPGNELKIGAFLGSLINFVIVMFIAYQLARIFARDLLESKK
jgi:large conductance mechanosensitive channel